MTIRTICKVRTAFSDGIRNIKFIGNPKTDDRVTVITNGLPRFTLKKDMEAKMWVASCQGTKRTVQARAAAGCYQLALAKFWA